MKNFKNYICLFLMILGINVNVKAEVIINTNPSPILINAEITSGEIVDEFNVTYTVTGATAYSGVYGYVTIDGTGDNKDDMIYGITGVTEYEIYQNGSFNIYYYTTKEGTYTANLIFTMWIDEEPYYEQIEIPITINVISPVVLTNYQTYCPRTVSFDLNGLSGEAPEDIVTKKNLTITDPGDPVTPVGTDFLGWYNGDTKWNFETDVVTEDMRLYAKCQSALTISGNVHLTSGKDVQVYTTPATNNMITVSWFGKDVAEATKIRFSYYLNGQKVKDTQSPFRVCDATSYNFIDRVNNEGDNFEQTFAVSYKPTAYDQLDNYTIRVEAVNDAGTQVYRTADLSVYGRSLPEQFVMVIKKTTDDKGWYAIPNELASASDAKAEDMPMPLLVEVDDNTAPTAVMPSENANKALYTAAARNTISNNRGGIRLKSVANDKFMTATTTNNNSFYMPNGNREDDQPFYLTSSDFGAYKVTLNPALYENNPPNRWISMYAGKIAWYNTQACDVYFLPINNYVVIRENLTNGKIGTMCQAKEIVAVKGGTLYQPNYEEGNYLEFIEVKLPVAAGMPLIYQADGTNNGNLAVIYGAGEESEALTGDQTRGMVGYIGEDKLDVPNYSESNKNYVFQNNKLLRANQNYLINDRAYVSIDAVHALEPIVEEPIAAPRRRLVMDVESRTTPTGWDDVLKADNIRKLIINDKMYILRAGKMYDATGKFVK